MKIIDGCIMLQIDLLGSGGVVTRTLFANLAVMISMAAMLVLAFGSLYLLIDFRKGKTYLLYGFILAGIIGFMSITYIGTIPTSFDDVAELGLGTLPDNFFVTIFNSIMGLIYSGVSWISGLLIPIGVIMTIGRINWGPKILLVGFLVELLIGLVYGGGIFPLVLAVMEGMG